MGQILAIFWGIWVGFWSFWAYFAGFGAHFGGSGPDFEAFRAVLGVSGLDLGHSGPVRRFLFWIWAYFRGPRLGFEPGLGTLWAYSELLGLDLNLKCLDVSAYQTITS